MNEQLSKVAADAWQPSYNYPSDNRTVIVANADKTSYQWAKCETIKDGSGRRYWANAGGGIFFDIACWCESMALITANRPPAATHAAPSSLLCKVVGAGDAELSKLLADHKDMPCLPCFVRPAGDYSGWCLVGEADRAQDNEGKAMDWASFSDESLARLAAAALNAAYSATLAAPSPSVGLLGEGEAAVRAGLLLPAARLAEIREFHDDCVKSVTERDDKDYILAANYAPEYMQAVTDLLATQAAHDGWCVACAAPKVKLPGQHWGSCSNSDCPAYQEDNASVSYMQPHEKLALAEARLAKAEAPATPAVVEAGGGAEQITTLQSALESATDTNRVLAARLSLAVRRLPQIAHTLSTAQHISKNESLSKKGSIEALYDGADEAQALLSQLKRELNGGSLRSQESQEGSQDE